MRPRNRPSSRRRHTGEQARRRPAVTERPPARGRDAPASPGFAAPTWALGLLLVGLTLVTYAPALENGFVWDDDDYVTANQTLESARGLWEIWRRPGAVPQYYPLTFTTLWLDYRLWGLEPFGYHLGNVLLHALNAVLLWRVLAALAVPGAWLGAAVFAVHPVHVESVAWITERKNVLSGAFFLAALLAYLRWERRGGWRPYILALGLFLAALLSKTVAATLPAVVLVLAWWRRGRLTPGDVAATLPFALLGAAMALGTIWMERHHVGAAGADWALSAAERCLVAGRALWFYAGKLLWPARLTFFYPRWTIDAGLWWQWLFPAAAAAVACALFAVRRRIGRGPLASVLVYAVTLLPALGFVPVFPMRYSFVADHFQYLGSIGLIALAAAVATRHAAAARRAAAAGAALVLLVLATLAWRQTHVYRDLATLWADTIAKNPRAWMAHNNLGLLLVEEGRVEEGMAHYRAALAAKPDDTFAENNLANALAQLGHDDEAMEHYRRALAIEPTHAEAHNNLGNVLARRGHLEEAMAEYEAALGARPRYADAHNNLGNVLAALGRPAEAIARFEEALRIEPGFADPHHNLGVLFAADGRLAEAIGHYQAALRTKPRWADARARLGAALAAAGRVDEAMVELEAALRIDPGHVEAQRTLARVRARRGP
jgi:tetratricopeptide (TPR) repeat protein